MKPRYRIRFNTDSQRWELKVGNYWWPNPYWVTPEERGDNMVRYRPHWVAPRKEMYRIFIPGMIRDDSGSRCSWRTRGSWRGR